MSGELTQEALDYLQAHASDTYVPDIRVSTVITGAFSVLFVGLRLYSRYVACGRLRLQLSDWLLLIAWVIFLTVIVSLNIFTLYGGGRHVIFISNLRMVHIISIEMEALYLYSMAFIKFSILALYGSIFPQRRFHQVLWATVAFVTAWVLSASFVTIFQCTPFSFVWDRDQPGFCINLGAGLIVFGIFNILTDFMILALPIPLVRRLNVSKSKKRLLIIIFATGGSACIASIVRLVYTLNIGEIDGTYTAIPAAFVSITELLVGILAASIPTYSSLHQKFFGKPKVPTGKSYTYDYGSKSNGISYKYARDGQYSVNASVGQSVNRPPAGVTVTDQFELVRHANRGGTWVRVSDDDEAQLCAPRSNKTERNDS